jgi:CRP-like cAMP-binding protein
MVVVLSGRIEVADDSHGRRVLFAQAGPGQFAGELNLLTGQPPYLTIRVTGAGQVITIGPGQVRELLAREAEVAEVLMTAFIARRRRRVADHKNRDLPDDPAILEQTRQYLLDVQRLPGGRFADQEGSGPSSTMGRPAQRRARRKSAWQTPGRTPGRCRRASAVRWRAAHRRRPGRHKTTRS